MEKTTLIVDGLNIFIRSYCVIPTLNKHGEHFGGVLGFLRSLGSYARRFSPDEIIVIWESGGSATRRKVFSDYKANRAPLRVKRNDVYEDAKDSKENFNTQLQFLANALKNTPIRQMYIPDCEADDVIGYLAKYQLENRNVIIASSDKDFYQLVSDRVKIYSPTKKKIITKDDIIEEYNIHPNNFVTARTFVGDSSDNIPGIKGIGLKTMAKRFPKLRNMEIISCSDIIKECNAIPEKKRIKFHKGIVENEDVIHRNWGLMYLDTGNLEAEHITKIKNDVQIEEMSYNKFGLIKEMTQGGVDMPKSFNPHKFFTNIASLKNNK